MAIQRLFQVLAALQACAFVSFLYGAWQASQAIGKHGFGDPEALRYWSGWQGLSFWGGVLLWVLGTAVAWRVDRTRETVSPGRSLALLFGAGVPALFVVTYTASMFFP